nr:hypothetical protein [Cupriavidus oxalaticus]
MYTSDDDAGYIAACRFWHRRRSGPGCCRNTASLMMVQSQEGSRRAAATISVEAGAPCLRVLDATSGSVSAWMFQVVCHAKGWWVRRGRSRKRVAAGRRTHFLVSPRLAQPGDGHCCAAWSTRRIRMEVASTAYTTR